MRFTMEMRCMYNELPTAGWLDTLEQEGAKR